jgi:hypothetical protein
MGDHIAAAAAYTDGFDVGSSNFSDFFYIKWLIIHPLSP